MITKTAFKEQFFKNNLEKTKMMIDIYDLLLGAMVLFLIYAAVKHFIKSNRFGKSETTEGVCTDVRSTRYNFIACVNRYFYTYTVNGVSYTGEDSEGFWFRRNIKDLTNPVTVEYLKDSPEVSRLAAVNHRNGWKVILTTLLVVALFVYMILYKNGIL